MGKGTDGKAFWVGAQARFMLVIGKIAKERIVGSEIVDQVLLVIIEGQTQSMERAPVEGVIRSKSVLRVVGVEVGQLGVTYVAVETESW